MSADTKETELSRLQTTQPMQYNDENDGSALRIDFTQNNFQTPSHVLDCSKFGSPIKRTNTLGSEYMDPECGSKSKSNLGNSGDCSGK